MFATVRSYILTVRGHSLVRVSIWYSSLRSVVNLSCLWCFNEIFDAVEMEKNFEKLWKLKIKRKPLEKSVFSRQPLQCRFKHQIIRLQSVNCPVRVSRSPQFRIRKSDIFGAENWSFGICRHVVTRVDRFFHATLRNCSFSR